MKLIDCYKIKSQQLNELIEKYNNLQNKYDDLRDNFIKYKFYTSIIIILLLIYAILLNIPPLKK